VDTEQPDLQGRIANGDWAEFDFDGNRIVGSEPHDSDKHGTHVAGTIAGGDNSGQWIGVAPQANIAGCLVLKNGDGTDAQILAGIEWAIEQGADIINMSLGGLRLSPDVFDTYTQSFITANLSGIPVVVSIGNEGGQTSGSPGNDYFAFSVGATDSRDKAAGFSGGRTQIFLDSNVISQADLPLVFSKPDVSAPGVSVKSAIPGNKYAIWNGTSMSAPHVAGAMALLLSSTTIRDVDPSERAFLIQDLLMSTVEELGESGQDHRFGFGRIDILKAVGYAWELGYGVT
jgi:subtilisin family serine protease